MESGISMRGHFSSGCFRLVEVEQWTYKSAFLRKLHWDGPCADSPGGSGVFQKGEFRDDHRGPLGTSYAGVGVVRRDEADRADH